MSTFISKQHLLLIFSDFTSTNIEKSFGEDYFEIHWYFFQVWTWSLPTRSRKEELYGSSQERQTKCCGGLNYTLKTPINSSQLNPNLSIFLLCLSFFTTKLYLEQVTFMWKVLDYNSCDLNELNLWIGLWKLWN